MSIERPGADCRCQGHAVRCLDRDEMAPFRPRLEIENIGEEFGRFPFVLHRDDRVKSRPTETKPTAPPRTATAKPPSDAPSHPMGCTASRGGCLAHDHAQLAAQRRDQRPVPLPGIGRQAPARPGEAGISASGEQVLDRDGQPLEWAGRHLGYKSSTVGHPLGLISVFNRSSARGCIPRPEEVTVWHVWRGRAATGFVRIGYTHVVKSLRNQLDGQPPPPQPGCHRTGR